MVLNKYLEQQKEMYSVQIDAIRKKLKEECKYGTVSLAGLGGSIYAISNNEPENLFYKAGIFFGAMAVLDLAQRLKDITLEKYELALVRDNLETILQNSANSK